MKLLWHFMPQQGFAAPVGAANITKGLEISPSMRF
jgi:hypothetical protein